MHEHIETQQKESKMKISTITQIIIICSIFIIGTVKIIDGFGTIKAEELYCKENFRHLTNVTWEGHKTWMITRDDGFPNSCCMETGFSSYERDAGTGMYFLFGKHGSYTDHNCEWIDGSKWGEKKYPDFIEPSFFKKTKLTIRTFKEMS